jgi:hypothetical protein
MRLSEGAMGRLPARALPLGALAGFLYFIAVVLSEPFLRPHYSLLSHPISDFAIGRYGYLQTSALFALGAAVLLLDVSLLRVLSLTRLSRTGLVALTLCGFASFGTGIWPTDLAGSVVQTTSGALHAVSAYGGYSSLATAMVLLSLHFRRERAWRHLFVPSLVLSFLGIVTLAFVVRTSGTAIEGLTQRIMAVPLLVWLLVIATRASLVRASTREMSRSRGRPLQG